MKNKYEILGETTVIFIRRRNGDVFNTFIDTVDLDKAQSFPGSWYVNYNQKTKSYYVMGNYKKENGKTSLIGLHRFLMNPPDDMVVDHYDRNTLNNKRKNLRVVTVEQNNQNTSLQKNNKAGARGVFWCKSKNKYRAYVKHRGKYHYFGYFTSVKDAAIAAENGRKKLLPYAN
ncbi:HNH endonuclease [Cytobacillus pseudoceanisediminis]|uniref:HNH endonuclease n=1 Tax=Cytobacillus pseudoceanisediminis TaxID=3051614 RepID=A0ABZ2ZGC7_9BACI